MRMSRTSVSGEGGEGSPVFTMDSFSAIFFLRVK
jgi:hypothetical protein